jgi:hypothetical protein
MIDWFVHTLRSYPEIAIFLSLALGYYFGSFTYKGLGLGAVTATSNSTSTIVVCVGFRLPTIHLKSAARSECFRLKSYFPRPGQATVMRAADFSQDPHLEHRQYPRSMTPRASAERRSACYACEMWCDHDPIKIRRDMGEDQGNDILAPQVHDRQDDAGDDRGSS